MQQQQYPVRFSVDYPDRSLDRVTTAFRISLPSPSSSCWARSRVGPPGSGPTDEGRPLWQRGREAYCS